MDDGVALLGDLVGSRRATDRQQWHDDVSEVLATISARDNAAIALRITAGDEFQGTYTRLGDALGAVFAIRMHLEPRIGVRFGIGRGKVTVLDDRAGTQDGPAWWAARAAIESVQSTQGTVGGSALRTAYRRGDSIEGEPDPTEMAVNAALVCQDLVFDSFDERTWTILRGLAGGMTQQVIAEQIGVSRQAVQQRRASSGMPMLLEAAERLAALP